MNEINFLPKDYSPDLPVLDETIEDVSKTTGAYITSHYRKHLIVGGILWIVWAGVIIYWIMVSPDLDKAFLILAPIILFFGFQAYVHNKILSIFMRQFAAANHYQYQQDETLDGLNGFAFDIGHSRKATNVVSGQYQGHPLKLFHYNYTIGYGKHSHTYYLTVFKLTLDVRLTDLFLRSKRLDFGKSLTLTFKNEQQIHLEGNFDQFFTLLAPKGFQIEALQIFSPDFMLKMRDEWQDFSLEFIGNDIYLYCENIIDKKDKLYKMYDLARHLLEAMKPALAKMQKGLLATSPYLENKL